MATAPAAAPGTAPGTVLGTKADETAWRPASVLVAVGLDLTGDALMKLPFLRSLRARCPAARISWMTLEGPSAFGGALAPLVEGLIDELLPVPEEGAARRRHLGGLLRRPLGGRRFDLVIDSQQGLGTTLRLRRIPHRRFVSAAAGWRLSDAWPPGRPKAPLLLDRFRHLLQAGAGPGPWVGGPPALPEAFRRRAETLLPAGPRYLGLAPGAGIRRKAWPLERYLELGRAAAAAGLVPVVLLGPAEADMLAPVRAALPEALLPEQQAAAGEEAAAGPLLTIALAGRLAAAVANDSGVGHLLAAGAAPLVSLFGPTSPVKFAPAAARLAVLRAQDFGGEEMADLPLEPVLRAALEMAGG